MDFYGINMAGHITVDSDNQFDIGDSSHRVKKLYVVESTGTSTSAQWADLAEKYTYKGNCEPGTVVCVSKDTEVDIEPSFEELSISYVGVISENPGFKMNSNLPNSLYVGLVGILPVKISGPIKKGDFIVTTTNGCARAGNRGEEVFKIGVCNENKNSSDIKLVKCII